MAGKTADDIGAYRPADHRRLGLEQRDLLEIIDDRDGKGSLLLTSQVLIGRWHEIIGDPTSRDAILDRVVHRAHRLELKGKA